MKKRNKFLALGLCAALATTTLAGCGGSAGGGGGDNAGGNGGGRRCRWQADRSYLGQWAAARAPGNPQ